MTDSLRDRIAEALFDACCRYEVPDAERFDMADAVIRELGPLVRYWDKDFKELHYCRECGGWGPKDD